MSVLPFVELSTSTNAKKKPQSSVGSVSWIHKLRHSKASFRGIILTTLLTQKAMFPTPWKVSKKLVLLSQWHHSQPSPNLKMLNRVSLFSMQRNSETCHAKKILPAPVLLQSMRKYFCSRYCSFMFNLFIHATCIYDYLARTPTELNAFFMKTFHLLTEHASFGWGWTWNSRSEMSCKWLSFMLQLMIWSRNGNDWNSFEIIFHS